MRLDGPRDSRIVLTVAGPLDRDGWSQAQLRPLQQLLPHLRQYVRVRQALVDANALGASFSALLENTRTGVVQLDRRARVLVANDRARQFLRAGHGLTYQDGLLRAAASAEDATLQGLLARAVGARGAAPSGGSMTLRARRARRVKRRLVLHASPVDVPTVHAPHARVAALVLLIEPSPRVRIRPDRLAALLGLTAAESELAVLLAEGRTLRDVAAATGRSLNTLRWHLKHIFAKHGLSRQLDLIDLVRSLDVFRRPRR